MVYFGKFSSGFVIALVAATAAAKETADAEQWHQLKIEDRVRRSLLNLGDIGGILDGVVGGGGSGDITSFQQVCDAVVDGSTGDAALDAVESCTCDSSLTSMSAACTTSQDYCYDENEGQTVCIKSGSSFNMTISIGSTSSASSCVTLAEGTNTFENNDLIGKEMCLGMTLDLASMISSITSNELPIQSCTYSLEGKTCTCDICESKQGMKITCDQEDYITCDMTDGTTNANVTEGLGSFKSVGTIMAQSVATRTTPTPSPTPSPTSGSRLVLSAMSGLLVSAYVTVSSFLL